MAIGDSEVASSVFEEVEAEEEDMVTDCVWGDEREIRYQRDCSRRYCRTNGEKR